MRDLLVDVLKSRFCFLGWVTIWKGQPAELKDGVFMCVYMFMYVYDMCDLFVDFFSHCDVHDS